MFNRLPPEIVRQIIESSVPSTHYPKTYCDRQATLCQLCLVCRLFRDIAQPLLFEIVWIDRQWKLDALHKTLGSEVWRGSIRQLIFEAESDQEWEDLKWILRSCQGLQSLALQRLSDAPLDLSMLQGLPRKPLLYIINEKLFALNPTLA